MTVNEAEIRGCPPHLIAKMRRHGIASFSTPHDLDNINWKKLERDVDFLLFEF
ncbi:unnamed protein product, partial [marine sediment metagenome]